MSLKIGIENFILFDRTVKNAPFSFLKSIKNRNQDLYF